jgi:hypothetical protein
MYGRSIYTEAMDLEVSRELCRWVYEMGGGPQILFI